VGTSKETTFLSTKYYFILVIMAWILRNRTEIEQELILEVDPDEAISWQWKWAWWTHYGTGDNIWSKSQLPWNSGRVHPFIGTLSGLKIQEALHINKDSSLISLFLFFMDIIQLLIAETNKHYNQHLCTLDNDRCSWFPDMTVQEIMYFWLLSYK
jgi:hypothetical protein